MSENKRIHADWLAIADRGTSPRARAPTGRAYFERVSATEQRRIEPFPLPAAARLRVTFRTRERECGGEVEAWWQRTTSKLPGINALSGISAGILPESRRPLEIPAIPPGIPPGIPPRTEHTPNKEQTPGASVDLDAGVIIIYLFICELASGARAARERRACASQMYLKTLTRR